MSELDNRCQAYKCTAHAGEVFPFCTHCAQLIGGELAGRIKRGARGRRWTLEFAKAIGQARVRIARALKVPEIEIDQFMHHDEILQRKLAGREERKAAGV